ncbi:ferredoxin [Candidatus Woesearchaeota archaeon]|nr:ferredoxin [Candidatus Woesearchaeota archaeon]
MAKYTITFDRDGCIGAAACVSENEANWRMGTDGKADVLKRDIEEDELAANKAAAEACPVGVIHIMDNETGERLV